MRRRPVRSLRIPTISALLIGGFAVLFLSLSAYCGTSSEPPATARASSPQTVLLDAWFNSQQRRSTSRQMEYYHYKWDDTGDSGFSMLGQVFRDDGVATKTLYTAPTRRNLAGAQYYILVSPDNVAKNPHAHFMTDASARQVSAWVTAGGVLLLLENDPANADIVHMDKLADIFGLHFNDVLVHHVVVATWRWGALTCRAAARCFIIRTLYL